MIASRTRPARFVTLIAVGLVFAALSADAAFASSPVCRQLEAELASTSRNVRSDTQVRKYDVAINKQRDQLRKARGQRQNAGCGRSLFGNGVVECDVLNAKMERMERNLEALQRKRNELSGEGSARVHARIMASLDANRCREGSITDRTAPRGADRNADLLGQIFGGGIKERPLRQSLDDDLDAVHVRRLPDPLEETGGGRSVFVPMPAREFRTLCVRTCDGYFFPMSAASSSSDFGRDQKACESSCSGTDIRVYHHRLIGEQPADMVSSVSGAPYSELPTAYLYRKSGTPRPAGCSCNARKNFKIIAGNPPAQTSIIEMPDPSAKPDAAPAMVPEAPVKTYDTGNRKVRVVGPAFLPDPEEAIDLLAPAPKKAP